jgi:nucleotide-binding universal stress UspA family protein
VYRRVLVPLDGSHFGERALPTALSLAERFGAELRTITVASPTAESSQPRGSGVAGDESRERARSRASEYLTEVEARIRRGGFDGPLSTEVIPAGNAAHSVVRDAVESEADLIVMTTHGRGPLQRAWLGSTADGVIRRSPRPVLLLRPEGEASKEPVDLAGRTEPFRKVLIPLDGSRAGELVLGLAAPLSADDASITLLRVVPPFLPGGSPYLPHVLREGEDHEAVKKAAAGYLQEVTGRFAEGGRTVVAEVATGGQPGVTILRVAEEEGIDLIAMSSHGRGGVSRLLLGSVADKVVRGAPCPILLHREPEEES